MTQPIFDHDRLDGYRLSIEYFADSFEVTERLHRHARDPWLRAAQTHCVDVEWDVDQVWRRRVVGRVFAGDRLRLRAPRC